MAKKQELNNAPMKIETIDIVLVGMKGSPLVVHQMGKKVREEIAAKQMKKAAAVKEKRDPHQEFLDARHVDDKGRECVRADGLKKSFISAATAFDNLTKIALRQAFFVYPTISNDGMLIPIQRSDDSLAVGEFFEEVCTISHNTRSLTYRPIYRDWKLRVTIEYNPRLVSEEQLLAIIDHAGWGVGICEGRPEKTSALGWGRFKRA